MTQPKYAERLGLAVPRRIWSSCSSVARCLQQSRVWMEPLAEREAFAEWWQSTRDEPLGIHNAIRRQGAQSMKWEPRVTGIVAVGAAFLFAATLAVVPAVAQVVTGTLGSPSATSTLQGNQLPAP